MRFWGTSSEAVTGRLGLVKMGVRGLVGTSRPEFFVRWCVQSVSENEWYRNLEILSWSKSSCKFVQLAVRL